MFLSRNSKNNVYPCKLQFYNIKKWGLRGSKLYMHIFVMAFQNAQADLNLVWKYVFWQCGSRVIISNLRIIRKHAYSNILKIIPPKNAFQIKEFWIITKTRLYNIDSLKPHFYIVKLGFTGVSIIFLFLLKSIDCGYSLEPPRGGGSNEYHNLCFEQKYEKNIRVFFYLKIFCFWR